MTKDDFYFESGMIITVKESVELLIFDPAGECIAVMTDKDVGIVVSTIVPDRFTSYNYGTSFIKILTQDGVAGYAMQCYIAKIP